MRVVNGAGEFYDKVTGLRFVPRGSNFIRVAPQVASNGQVMEYHSLFNIGRYAKDDVESALSRMQASGYNVVRVFLNQLASGNPAGGLSEAYLDNVADLIRRAASHGIYVIVVADFVPVTPEYMNLYGAAWGSSFDDFWNITFLSPAGIEAHQKFWLAFITGLQGRNVPLASVFSWQLTNEGAFSSDFKPLTLTSGRIVAANGVTYDMAAPSSKQAMIEDSVVYWNDTLRATILSIDPEALVSNSFLVPQTPNPDRQGDPRLSSTRPAILTSKLDFVDLHPYPGWVLDLPQYAQNYGFTAPTRKPVIMGEFGAQTSSYPTLSSAATTLQAWQVESCGFGFSGWLMWTWDLEQMPDGSRFWSVRSGDGAIDEALSPNLRPDPCAKGVFAGQNVAPEATAIASGSNAGFEAANAIDGRAQTLWISGALPPQWIEIRLPRVADLAEIRLTTHQPPQLLATTHDVYVRQFGGPLVLAHQFKGFTNDDDVLSWKPSAPLADVIAVRVETTETTSWVAWKEIELLAAKPRQPKRTVVEYFNSTLDHYFISWAIGEITSLDGGTPSGWARTGKTFQTMLPGQTGASPICRFYIPPHLGNSHFFGRGTAECGATAQANPTFVLESSEFMNMLLPANGACPADTVQVYRVFSNRTDANHRYMTDKATRAEMVTQGWLVEGDGPDAVVMCAPP